MLLLQAVGVLFFTISVPVEVVFAQHSLHAGAAGYGAMVSAWGAGAVAGAAIYARWRRRPSRELIAGGALSLGLGFMVMASAPTLAVAIVGAALGGVGNGLESVAARTALQEESEEQWMAMMMSLYEALFQSVPGAGMLIGGGDHRAREPARGAGRGRRGLARGHRGGLVCPGRIGPADGAPPGAPPEPPGPGRAGAAAGSRPGRAAARSCPHAGRPTSVESARGRRPPAESRLRPLPIVRRACIDIGSNTTRLLVADCDGERLVEVHQERAFTHVRRALTPSEEIEAEKIVEVAAVVAGQLQRARDLGAAEVLGVATAAVRQAANGEALVTAVRESCGLEVAVLSAEEEARLAFKGAARTLGYAPAGALGVVDVGGGSSELVVGTVPDRIEWYASFPVGSGQLTDECLPSDPPSAEEIARAARADQRGAGRRAAPAGGVRGRRGRQRHIAAPDRRAAARRRRVRSRPRPAGRRAALRRWPRRFELDADRVRLLPAGLLILQAAAERFGAPLEVGRGGLREGLLLEMADV